MRVSGFRATNPQRNAQSFVGECDDDDGRFDGAVACYSLAPSLSSSAIGTSIWLSMTACPMRDHRLVREHIGSTGGDPNLVARGHQEAFGSRKFSLSSPTNRIDSRWLRFGGREIEEGDFRNATHTDKNRNDEGSGSAR